MLAALPMSAAVSSLVGFFRITFTKCIPHSMELLMGGCCSSSLRCAPRLEQISEVHSTVRERSIESGCDLICCEFQH
jgi:hypothetical protein